MINNLESYNKAQLIELVKTQIEEYQKLDKDHASLKKFVNFQGEVVTNSEIEIADLEQNLGLIKLGIEQQHKQLISCETALDERNNKVSLQASRIAELEKERDELSATVEAHIDALSESLELARKHDKELAKTLHILIGWSPQDLLKAHNLEQQAKGIDWVLACRELNLSEGEVHTLMDKCNQLREGVK